MWSRHPGQRRWLNFWMPRNLLSSGLWRSEVAAGPLDTPEDRAGLKQRLGGHMANIADAEIRRHYADAFRERFDTLFAPKPRAPFQPNSAPRKGKARDWRAPQILPPGAETKSFNAKNSDFLVQGCAGGSLTKSRIDSASSRGAERLRSPPTRITQNCWVRYLMQVLPKNRLIRRG